VLPRENGTITRTPSFSLMGSLVKEYYMNTLEDLINKKRLEIKRTDKPSRVNLKWEQAKEFIRYVGFEDDFSLTVYILKLFKIYGQGQVLSLKSWLKDYSCDKNRIRGLLVWKLKKDQFEAKSRNLQTNLLTTGN